MKTKADAWQEMRVPLRDFKYTAFGRRIGDRSPEASRIRSVEFTLADKKAGPFRLEVAWIKAEKSDQTASSDTGAKTDSTAGSKDIVDIAASTESFKTLVAAVSKAGLVETLKGPGPFTVFAPRDEAFEALPAGTVEDLLRPANRDRLASILKYHVLPTRLLLAQDGLKTLQGGTIQVRPSGKIKVEQANIVAMDIKTTNGYPIRSCPLTLNEHQPVSEVIATAPVPAASGQSHRPGRGGTSTWVRLPVPR